MNVPAFAVASLPRPYARKRCVVTLGVVPHQCEQMPDKCRRADLRYPGFLIVDGPMSIEATAARISACTELLNRGHGRPVDQRAMLMIGAQLTSDKPAWEMSTAELIERINELRP